MKYYIYELINLMGTVEYVGETTTPEYRFYQHTKKKPGKGQGKFFKRQDLMMNIVDSCYTKKEAWKIQCELQNEYELVSDRQILAKGGKIGAGRGGLNGAGGKKVCSIVKVCPHCGKIGKSISMFQWHFDKCKNNIVNGRLS